jgi:hypothetical protein
MDKEKFEALLPLIVTALIQKMMEHKKITQDEAFPALYCSGLYRALEDEKNKVLSMISMILSPPAKSS